MGCVLSSADVANRNWMSIDPGLQGTGWALWHERTAIAAGIVRARVQGTVPLRAWDIALQIQSLTVTHSASFTACEWPRLMSEVTARRGDLVKLTFVVGVLCGATAPLPFLQVEVAAWKGQLSKAITEKRIRRFLGDDTCEKLKLKSHMWDAVGIGLYLIGRF